MKYFYSKSLAIRSGILFLWQPSCSWTTTTCSTTSIRTMSSSTTNASATALVLLADGVEEMEAVIAIDVLRRGNVNVTVAGINGTDAVTASRGVKLLPDTSISVVIADKHAYDLILLPGGLQASKTFGQSTDVGHALRDQEKAGRKIAAICAGPVALKEHGIGVGKRITSYPSVKNSITEGGRYEYSEERVVRDGELTTSRGPGTAFEFALALVEQLSGKEKADSVKEAMLMS